MNKITKNQHYVPQMLLRGFIIEGTTNQINSYDIYSYKFFKANIRRVCSKDFFYDEQNEFENILSQIEANAGKIISLLRKGDYQLLKDDKNKEYLIIFIIVQIFRTESALKTGLARIDNMQMQLVRDLINKNFGNINNGFYGYFKYDENDEWHITQANLRLSVLMSLGMCDLKIHILESHPNEDFILSNNPAVLYNYILCNKQNFMSSSPFASGAMIYLPISNSKCICLYDGCIYKFGKIRKSRSSIICKQDVEWLNLLQMMNDAKTVYYSNYTNNIASAINKYKNLKDKQLYKEYFKSNERNIAIGKILIHKNKKPNFFKPFKNIITNNGYRTACQEWITILKPLHTKHKIWYNNILMCLDIL